MISCTYDDTDQLTQSTGSGANGSYTYDANFNRTSNNSFTGKGNRLLRDANWHYQYDKNGNLIGKNNFTSDPARNGTTLSHPGEVKVAYTYDNRNHLTSVATSNFNGVGDRGISYRYDTEDRLAERYLSDRLGDQEFFGYDGDNIVMVAKLSAEPYAFRRYLYAPGVAQALEMDSPAPGAADDSSPLYRYWLMTDHEGSIRREIKDNGTIARRIDSDEFGNIIGDKGFGPSPDLKVEGKFTDPVTDLTWYHARWYDPKMARFISVDPGRQGTNWSVYEGNNPLNMVDPTGMEAFGGGGFSGGGSLSNIFGTSGIVNTPSRSQSFPSAPTVSAGAGPTFSNWSDARSLTTGSGEAIISNILAHPSYLSTTPVNFFTQLGQPGLMGTNGSDESGFDPYLHARSQAISHNAAWWSAYNGVTSWSNARDALLPGYESGPVSFGSISGEADTFTSTTAMLPIAAPARAVRIGGAIAGSLLRTGAALSRPGADTGQTLKWGGLDLITSYAAFGAGRGLRMPLRGGFSNGAVENTGATFGNAASNNYRGTFFAGNPEFEGQVVVHHAVPQRTLTLYPNEVTGAQIHSLENLRGIPNEINSDLHLRQIGNEWRTFYKRNPNATQSQLLQKATELDARYGSQFRPPVGGGH